MTEPRPQTGLKLGLISFLLVTLCLVGVFLLGPAPETNPEAPTAPQAAVLLDQLQDAPTRRAVEALRAVTPATFTKLNEAAAFAVADGATNEALAQLVLEALFRQFEAQAGSLRSSSSDNYQAIVAGFSDGLGQ